MKQFRRRFAVSWESAVGLILAAVFLVAGLLLAAEVVEASQARRYFQISPLPTSTSTPAVPTNTPTPVLPTDTPTPVLPTNTPTPVLPTDTPTPVLPTNTPTPVPPTNTPTPVSNRPPFIESLSGPESPVNINDQPVTLVLRFTDPDAGDSHTVTWIWGDDSPPDLQTGAISPATRTHTYAAPGIYTIQATVEDAGGETDTALFTYVVIYDPAGGFVTGGGWFDSPPGAYTPNIPDDPDVTGRATFAFVSRYRRGASTPTGNTQFRFQTAGLEFYSDQYHWLIINQHDSNAQFKGTGNVNGEAQPYLFMIWASDDTPDAFRIKIWLETPAGDEPLYDNGRHQPIGGGSIVIHRGR